MHVSNFTHMSNSMGLLLIMSEKCLYLDPIKIPVMVGVVHTQGKTFAALKSSPSEWTRQTKGMLSPGLEMGN